METNANAGTAAALMSMLGEDLATSVIRHLGEDEVERLAIAMSRVGHDTGRYAGNLVAVLDAFEASRPRRG